MPTSLPPTCRSVLATDKFYLGSTHRDNTDERMCILTIICHMNFSDVLLFSPFTTHHPRKFNMGVARTRLVDVFYRVLRHVE